MKNLKQITYVIENDKGELFSFITGGYIMWTNLISYTKLFDNQYHAETANRDAKGKIKRMRYNLEEL